jgi:hypothetical protein
VEEVKDVLREVVQGCRGFEDFHYILGFFRQAMKCLSDWGVDKPRSTHLVLRTLFFFAQHNFEKENHLQQEWLQV